MRIKIKLQTEKPEDFELDLYAAYISVPIIMDNKMILGNYIACVDLLDETFNKLPEELKEILDKRKTKSFYLKRSILTITGLTAYQIRIGDTEEKETCAEKIFSNFYENKRMFFITSTCNFPYEAMLMYFQTAGEIFLEFDLEDIFFADYEEWYNILKKTKEEFKNINKEKYSNFLEDIHDKKYK